MTEDRLEKEVLQWLGELGYTHLYGPDIAPDSGNPERANYREVPLTLRLRAAFARLVPIKLRMPQAEVLVEALPPMIKSATLKRTVAERCRRAASGDHSC